MPVLNHPDGSPISEANPLPVSGEFTIGGEIEVKNDVGNPVPIAGTIELGSASLAALEDINSTITNQPNSLTDAQLRATPVAVSGTVNIGNFPTTQSVSGTVELGSTSLSALENTNVTISGTPTVNVNNFPPVQPVSGTVDLSTASLNALENTTVSVSNFPATQAVTATIVGIGTTAADPQFVSLSVGGTVVGVNNPLPNMPSPSTNVLSGATTAGATVTITLPAAGANLYHYIDSIEIGMYSSAARTGTATPVVVTTTNLNGFSKRFTSAGAIGSLVEYQLSSNRPLRSQSPNTNTTIVLPATTNVIWEYRVIYSTGV